MPSFVYRRPPDVRIESRSMLPLTPVAQHVSDSASLSRSAVVSGPALTAALGWQTLLNVHGLAQIGVGQADAVSALARYLSVLRGEQATGAVSEYLARYLAISGSDQAAASALADLAKYASYVASAAAQAIAQMSLGRGLSDDESAQAAAESGSALALYLAILGSWQTAVEASVALSRYLSVIESAQVTGRASAGLAQNLASDESALAEGIASGSLARYLASGEDAQAMSAAVEFLARYLIVGQSAQASANALSDLALYLSLLGDGKSVKLAQAILERYAGDAFGAQVGGVASGNIGKLDGIAGSGLSATGVSLALLKSLGMSEAAEAASSAAIIIAIYRAMENLDREAHIAASLSLGRDADVATDAQAQAQAFASAIRYMMASGFGQSSGLGSGALAAQFGLSVWSGKLVSLSVQLDRSADVALQILAESSAILTIQINLGVGRAGQAESQASLDVARSQAVLAIANAVIGAGLSLDSILSITGYGVNLTTLIVPTRRILIVHDESRTLVVPFEGGGNV